MLTVLFFGPAYAQCFGNPDPPPDVDGQRVGEQGCLVDESLSAGCVDRFDPTADGCCPPFRQLLHSTGWARQLLSQPDDGTIAVHCVGSGDRSLDMVRVYDPDNDAIEHRAYFEEDGTMVALYLHETIVYTGYTGWFDSGTWCCGGEFAATSLWWGEREAVELAQTMECGGPSDEIFAYAPEDIAGTVDADPGCDTPPATSTVPEDEQEERDRPGSCGCRTPTSTAGALVGMLALLLASVRGGRRSRR